MGASRHVLLQTFCQCVCTRALQCIVRWDCYQSDKTIVPEIWLPIAKIVNDFVKLHVFVWFVIVFNVIWLSRFRLWFSTFFQCSLICLFSFWIFQLSQPLLLNCRDESKLQSCCNCTAIPSDSNACTEMFIILLRNICSGNENSWSASYSEISKV